MVRDSASRNATARARSLEASLGRWRSWGEGPSQGDRQGPWRRNHSLWLEGDSHLFRRRGLPWTESPIVAISGARNELFVIALPEKRLQWVRSLEVSLGRWRSWGEGPSQGDRQGPWRDDESGRGWQRASDGGATLGEAMTGECPPQRDSARARLSWSHLEGRMPRSR